MVINNFQFLIFTMWKETERPQGIGLWSPVGLDYRSATGLGKQNLAGCKQNFVYTRTQEKGEVTPQETESDLPVSVRSLWWRYGLTVAWRWVRDTNYNSPGSQAFWNRLPLKESFWKRLPLQPLPLPWFRLRPTFREGTQPHPSGENWIKDLLRVQFSFVT